MKIRPEVTSLCEPFKLCSKKLSKNELSNEPSLSSLRPADRVIWAITLSDVTGRHPL